MAIAEINTLKDLGISKQLTFAYLTCERFYSISDSFVKHYTFGSTHVFREAIEFVYNSIFTVNYTDLASVEQLLQSVFKNIPGTNEFPNFHGTLAMYSGGIIYESVNLVKGIENIKKINDISDMAINIVDCYIQERDEMDYNDENFEEKILNDNAMQTELSLQKGIISYLTKIDYVEPSDIATLLQLQENNSSSLIF